MKNKTNFINSLLLLGIIWFVFGCADDKPQGQTNPSTKKDINIMNIPHLFNKLSFSLIVLTVVVLNLPSKAFCQTEKLGVVQYTTPPGMTKTPKENVIVFSDINQTTGAYCIITLYGATPGTGNPTGDFAREWKNLVVTNAISAKWQIFFAYKRGQVISKVRMSAPDCTGRSAHEYQLTGSVTLLNQ